MAATPEHAARVLGLDDQATLEEVRDMRRALALKYHPDRSDDLERSTRHMARINAAADLLIAHLKGLGAKPKRPAYKDFSHQHRARRKAADAEASSKARTEDASPRGEAGAQETRVRQSTTVAAPEPTMPPKDRELIQLAIKSYRRVLDQIGKAESGPTVDMKALAYPATA